MNSDEYYEEVYEELINGGAVGWVSGLIHKKLEKNIAGKFEHVLEVGAGHGQHLKYVKHDFSEYHETDYRVSNLPDRSSIKEKKVIQCRADATNLEDFKDDQFDRVISTCLIVHLEKPEIALQEWRRVTKHGGVISIQVACEPGIVLRFLRNQTTVRKAKKIGRDHLKFHYREHINFYSGIEMLIKDVFERDKISKNFWPFKVPSWNMNLVVIFLVKVDKS
jgi:phosphatidylethanolamine/phosphatidyl-N-methylethanolamine N-methyltransferase